MNIKVQGLLNAAIWIEEKYGLRALQEVLRECSPEVRERYSFAIAISWHPMEEFAEFLEVAERRLGHADGKVSEEVGAAGARANMRGVLVRFAQAVFASEYLTRRIAGLWRQFNDEGEMIVLEAAEGNVVLEVVGVARPRAVFCCTLTGWCREVGGIMGLSGQPIVRHVKCRTRGDSVCVYSLRRPRPARLSGPPAA